RQAGQYEYGVVARKVQRAPGLVGDMRAVQFAAALHRERRGQRKVAACVAHRQCTLSMVILTGDLRSTATTPASPSRSPDWAIGWPPWLILAPTKTCAALDSLSVGAMAIASLRVTVAGSLTGSPLASLSSSCGDSVTSTCSEAPGAVAAVVLLAAGAGAPPARASATAICSATDLATFEPGSSCGCSSRQVAAAVR